MDSSQLNRRAFLGNMAAAGMLTIAPDLQGHAAPPQPTAGTPLIRPGAGVAAEVEEVTLSDLAEGLETGRWTSRTLVRSYLQRIDSLDRMGPALNTVLEVNPEAEALAEQLDQERRASGPRSKLHGIPILVKDNIGTADKMHTSAGSLALADFISPRDATVVERLRAAGCLIIGKANMSEWANARGRAAIGGWSGRGRLTRNPYALDRSPGGSSSGSAAAVAASLAPAAVGTETVGSIVSPSSICGIVGLKPTVGLASRRGIIPVSITQDTPGPMCRTVRDAAILLSAIAGADPEDPATEGSKVERDYSRFLDPTGLKGARIGVARNLFGTSLVADRVVEKALTLMAAAGAVLVDPVEVEGAEAIWTFDAEVLVFELKASLNQYFASVGPATPIRSLADLIAFNIRHSDRELQWFGQETFIYAESKGPLSSPEYQRLLGLVRQLAREQGIDATISRHKLDAIVAPTQSPAWLTDVLLGDNALLGSFVASAAAGYPSITVPAGDVAGLPVGILFMGPAWSEGTLIKLAFGFEQVAQARRPPRYLPSLTVGL